MPQELNSAFEPAQLIKFPPNIALAWKKAGAYLWENNGWDFKGNAYLLHAEWDLERLTRETQRIGVNWHTYAEFCDGYITGCFGFNNDGLEAFDCTEIDEENLEICARLMDKLGIEWCGNCEGPFFTLFANKQQINQLIEKLKTPIAEWEEKQAEW
jgi:hypothetical protein